MDRAERQPQAVPSASANDTQALPTLRLVLCAPSPHLQEQCPRLPPRPLDLHGPAESSPAGATKDSLCVRMPLRAVTTPANGRTCLSTQAQVCRKPLLRDHLEMGSTPLPPGESTLRRDTDPRLPFALARSSPPPRGPPHSGASGRAQAHPCLALWWKRVLYGGSGFGHHVSGMQGPGGLASPDWEVNPCINWKLPPQIGPILTQQKLHPHAHATPALCPHRHRMPNESAGGQQARSPQFCLPLCPGAGRIHVLKAKKTPNAPFSCLLSIPQMQ